MKAKFRKILSPVLALVMMMSLVACSENPSSQPDSAGDNSTVTANIATAALWADATYPEDTVLETEGKNTVSVVIVAGDRTVTVQAKTDKETFGEMLRETGIATGDEGDYGLYIKVVNGISAVYETDGAFWSFCDADGNSMNYGVDGAQLTGTDTYQLVYTPA